MKSRLRVLGLVVTPKGIDDAVDRCDVGCIEGQEGEQSGGTGARDLERGAVTPHNLQPS